ncbi:hypothetical protein [Jiangella aurantiaca]|uniref:hypothetical protein n=1 Tax=Jiangella aurantiaca TaxID=2530373 RepID=UPI00193EB2D5|nr:hypothetical protein [Jiangella aurantiaca]
MTLANRVLAVVRRATRLGQRGSRNHTASTAVMPGRASRTGIVLPSHRETYWS